MKRRTFLGIGGSALALAVAGCLDDGADPGDEDEGDDGDEAGDRDEPDEEDGDEDEDDDGDAEDDDTEDGDERDEDDSEGEADDSATEGEEEVPEVVDTEFEVVSEGGGGEGDGEARVDIDGSVVEVEGSIVGRNGCYTARLDEAVVEEGTLVVRVEAYEDADEGEMCTQALVVVEYEARVELDGEVTEVRVEHDGEEVASEG
jgi:hypothetical protein